MKNDLDKILTTKHNYRYTLDQITEYCEYCNSRFGIGLGSDFATNCNKRFDREKFKKWIEFRNYSKVISPIKKQSKIVKYSKRFSNDKPITENQLLKDYLIINGISSKLLSTLKEYDKINNFHKNK